jgi:hypothetical protein
LRIYFLTSPKMMSVSVADPEKSLSDNNT